MYNYNYCIYNFIALQMYPRELRERQEPLVNYSPCSFYVFVTHLHVLHCLSFHTDEKSLKSDTYAVTTKTGKIIVLTSSTYMCMSI